ncbi:MAG: bifunctional UDP-N-acetylmuramoyl-tripeptide:D-alanyl-D-alanine ligase/alanine racemase [Salinivirgaceae bacterium]|nr:MAG: bifunctional UDP-N-acetylmuramoyl-tripeptide:D-alanyl-D-alanine ligase/alanine racemase [Salinivirgaceae bacterium]
MKFTEIAQILDCEVEGSFDAYIKYLLTDSRKVKSVNDVLFFAISGEFHDGHRYIEALIEKGVQFFVVSQIPEGLKRKASFIVVANVVDALQKVVSTWRSRYKLPVIGITGSNGKTIIKEWLSQMLEGDLRVTRNPGSYNSQIGVPLSVWMLNEDSQLGVFEAGISQPGEMSKLEQVIQPTIGIFTNIGDAHQENFDSFEHKLEEKLLLFKHSETLIFNDQGDWIANKIKESCNSNKLFSWSFENEADVSVTLNESSIKVSYKEVNFEVQLPFHDKASVENLMHSIATLLYLDYKAEYILSAVSRLRPVAMRLEQKAGKQNTTIINDSYNSDLGSLSNALDYLSQQNQHKRKVVILSDIFQSGFIKENLYKEVAVLLNTHKPDLLLGVGPDLLKYKEKFHLNARFFESTRKLISSLNDLDLSDSTILLKGSRSFQFENIDQLLENKSHRTVLQVNLNALADNLNYFKSILKKDVGIIAMVKAFSYGSGSHEIAQLLDYNRVSYLAVAFADEGVDLRTRGIQLPIMVMNPAESDFSNLITFGLEPVVFDFEMLSKLISFMQKEGERRFPFHLKTNTGMNRSGFNGEDIQTLIHKLKGSAALELKTVFTHLAAADEPQHDAFTHEQVAKYIRLVSQMESGLDLKVGKHVLNSAGTERFPDYQFDFVRLGIGLYGVSADNKDLAHVGRLSTRIAQIRQVDAGETVGYSRKGEVNQPKTIATIPIGYADGFRRALSNGVGKVWIKGQLVPVIGNVCMDMTMIDVSGLQVEEGDEVVIFGPELPIVEVAKWLETIPYEILTNVAARVKRVYTKE